MKMWFCLKNADSIVNFADDDDNLVDVKLGSGTTLCAPQSRHDGISTVIVSPFSAHLKVFSVLLNERGTYDPRSARQGARINVLAIYLHRSFAKRRKDRAWDNTKM